MVIIPLDLGIGPEDQEALTAFFLFCVYAFLAFVVGGSLFAAMFANKEKPVSPEQEKLAQATRARFKAWKDQQARMKNQQTTLDDEPVIKLSDPIEDWIQSQEKKNKTT